MSLVVDLIGKRSRDVIGRLSARQSCGSENLEGLCAGCSCLRCCIRNKYFLQDEVVSLKPNPNAWRAVGLSFVWTLLLDLSGLGGPTRGVNTPAGIALGVTGTRKLLMHVDGTVPVSEFVSKPRCYQL